MAREIGKIVGVICCLLLAGTIAEAGSENDGNRNVYYGEEAGTSLGSASDDNLFLGYGSGEKDDLGDRNVFVGNYSGNRNTVGSYNTFLGTLSGVRNIAGAFNTFMGYSSGSSNSSGSGNVFVGDSSGERNGEGELNTFVGSHSGMGNERGERNTVIGAWAGYGSAADINASVFLGYLAGSNAQRSNTLYIANGVSDKPLIYGEFDTGLLRINGSLVVSGDIESEGAVALSFRGESTKHVRRMLELRADNNNSAFKSDVAFSLTNGRKGFSWMLLTLEPRSGLAITKRGNGAREFRLYDTDPDDPHTVVLRLANGAWCDGGWHDASSRSLKTNIQALDGTEALEVFEKLRPVTYAYKAHPEDRKVGFIAEEVPELVADPGRRSLSAMDMVALLTKVVQEKDREIRQVKAEIETLKEENRKFRELEAKVSALEHLLHSSGK